MVVSSRQEAPDTIIQSCISIEQKIKVQPTEFDDEYCRYAINNEVHISYGSLSRPGLSFIPSVNPFAAGTAKLLKL